MSTYDDESSPSILVRYSSDNDNDSADVFFPADPRLVEAQLESQHLPQPPPPPPASPVSGVSTTSTTPFPDLWNIDRSLTPSPTMDSPEKIGVAASEVIQKLEENQQNPKIEVLSKYPELVHTKLCTQTDLESPIKKVVLNLMVEEAGDFQQQGPENRRLLDVLGEIGDEDDQSSCCCGCWTPILRIVMNSTRTAFSNLQRNFMEWALAHSGRPSSSRQQAQNTQSVAEKERQQAEEFVKENEHIPLDVLMTQNKQAQKVKAEEYSVLRRKKAPTLEEQTRGENGRIIFSQEYIDFMLYRDLQPLVDLRQLRHVEDILNRKIRERDQQRLAEELEAARIEAARIEAARIEAEKPNISNSSGGSTFAS